jgi:hypothetical protein
MVNGTPNVDTANDLSRPLDLEVFLQTQQILGPPALLAAKLLDTQCCFQVILSRRAKRHNVVHASSLFQSLSVMLLHSIIQIWPPVSTFIYNLFVIPCVRAAVRAISFPTKLGQTLFRYQEQRPASVEARIHPPLSIDNSSGRRMAHCTDWSSKRRKVVIIILCHNASRRIWLGNVIIRTIVIQ